MVAARDWSGAQLAEFLDVISSFPDEQAAIAAALELAAESVEAEVAAFVQAGQVLAAVGYPRDRVPQDELLLAASGATRCIEVPGVGSCHALGLPLDSSSPCVLLLARREDRFGHEEITLLRSMARAIGLTLRMHRTVEAERSSRAETERHSAENARLLASLQERQSLLERLFKIQRSISRRAPISQVLQAITEGAAELLGDEVVGLRLIDPDDPASIVLVASVGVEYDVAQAVRRGPIHEGLGGMAVTERRLVVTDECVDIENPLQPFVAGGLRAAMAAPVFQDGEPLGSLVVGTRDAGRRYGPTEQEMLLAFAEHASLALNDASALETMRKAIADALHLAHHDSLTGLPNRALVLEHLAEALARRGRGRRVGVLFVDLDRFKMVNDTLGHSVGDEVLIRVGERLRSAVRPHDMVGRLAGDEFVVLCENTEVPELLQVAETVASVIAMPLPLYGRDAVITASIGVAHSSGGTGAEDLLRDADVAMYRAKERGRCRIEVFDRSFRQHLLERLETEQSLRRALHNGEFRLHYQPILAAVSGRLLGFEALIRWEDPTRGLVPPAVFVPLAEETGLIVPIGEWVLHEACRQLARWRAGGLTAENLRVSVNLSARQFAAPAIVATVAEALRGAALPPGSLSLEITESVLMEEVAAMPGTMRALKDLGVSLSIDDFGTGYSSLSYLRRFPVDALKIDRSFVSGLGIDAEDSAIVTAVVSLARALGLSVVAEGVETAAQLEELRRLGCNAVQGYLLGRPQPAEQVEQVLVAIRDSGILWPALDAQPSLGRPGSDVLRHASNRELDRRVQGAGGADMAWKARMAADTSPTASTKPTASTGTPYWPSPASSVEVRPGSGSPVPSTNDSSTG